MNNNNSILYAVESDLFFEGLMSDYGGRAAKE